MKKFLMQMMALLSVMGLEAKAKTGELSAEDVTALSDSYKDKYGTDLAADMAAEDAETLNAETVAALANEFDAERESALQAAKNEAATLKAENDTLASEKAALEAEKANQATQLAEANEKIAKLMAEPEDSAVHAATVNNETKTKKAMAKHSKVALFGADNESVYALNKRHNLLSVGVVAHSIPTKSEISAFEADLDEFKTAMVKRHAELRENGLINALDYNALVNGTSAIDYTEINNALGEYVIRRSDLVLAYIRAMASVTSMFPKISGCQNKMAAPNAHFGELSQSYQSGNVFKGSVVFDAEIYNVAEVMFKFQFSSMEALEKSYIGYLNREGSDVIKWTLIEWVIINFATGLNNEFNKRAIIGTALPVQSGVNNPAIAAADGIYAALYRCVEEFKIQPFTTIGVYTPGTDMLSTVEAMYDAFYTKVDNPEDYKVYCNAKHKRKYIAEYRSAYGEDSDFTGNASRIAIAPDEIVWVPSASDDNYTIFIAEPGNICLLEDVPGEMYNFRYDVELEKVSVMSRWKEGAIVTVPGVKFANASALAANNFANQHVFINWPIEDSLTVASTTSVAGNWLFELDNHATGTGESAVAATDITTLSNVVNGRVYKFVAKAANDTLTKAGAFSKLETAFTAGAAGDYIKVYAEIGSDGALTGKMLELARKVTV